MVMLPSKVDKQKSPFPWFGGKSDAAPLVWAALGDVANYVEPFFGGGAVLLRRPHKANRSGYSETVNDKDGLLTNFWRALRADPDGVAEAASYPMSELDKHARAVALLAPGAMDVDRLAGDVTYHDVEKAGWWAWCVCSQIAAFGTGGPWWPDEHGRLVKSRDDSSGITRNLPAVGNAGRGVLAASLREVGVAKNGQWHPFVMPELRDWLAFLSARLRHVRILCGDWQRCVGHGVLNSTEVRLGKTVGVFLDPPYSNVNVDDLYKEGGTDAAVACAEWAVGLCRQPRWKTARVVAAGYVGDDAGDVYEAAGWRTVEWFRDGFAKGGYRATGSNDSGAVRERLYLSPSCADPIVGSGQFDLFDEM